VFSLVAGHVESHHGQGREAEEKKVKPITADPRQNLKRGEPELFVLLVCFTGDWEVHRRTDREEEKETIPIYQLAGLHRRRRVGRRAATVPALLLRFQKWFLCNSRSFGDCFVNFGLCNFIFV
jgi:hypothetical protein